MKRMLAFCFLFVFAFTVACGSSERQESTTVTESEISVESIIEYSEYQEHGNPNRDRYTTSVNSRIPWDMAIYDGYLYVGCGDFDVNTGPCDAYRLNLESNEWENSGVLDDEQINRFLTINGKLTVPGTDPKADWSLGNYYIMSDNSWTTVRTLPCAIHTFDLVEYNDMLFAATGSPTGSFPVKCSSDGGATFNAVDMFKDNRIYIGVNDDINRVYDIFVQNEKLYAIFHNLDVFEFSGDSFYYLCSWAGKFATTNKSFVPIFSKQSYNGYEYLATGYLFRVADGAKLEYVNLPIICSVRDLLLYDDKLLVLCSIQNEEGYLNKVYIIQDETVSESVAFQYSVAAQSFEYQNGVFWFGMGSIDITDSNNGMVLSVSADI